jgi:hypothetical protein
MDLRDQLVVSKPRERAGSTSADRFDYQRDWALCKLLLLHQSTADYLIAFDVFDDVVVLNGESNPSKISFFQIKTRDKPPLTVARLLQRRQGQGTTLPSILGKLYYNKLVFPDHTEALTVVSNVLFQIELCDKAAKSTDKRVICCNQLAPNIQQQIAEQLRGEHALGTPPVFADFTYLEVSEIPLGGHATFMVGKLSEFLEAINPTGTFRMGLAYRAIADEIKRKNNHHADFPSFDEFVREKGIGRSTFDRMLRAVGAYQDFESLWRQIEGRLNTEHVPVLVARRLRDAFRRYSMERATASDVGIAALEALVHGELADEAAFPLDPGVVALLDHVVQRIRTADLTGEYRRFDDNYIRAAGLVALYEK